MRSERACSHYTMDTLTLARDWIWECGRRTVTLPVGLACIIRFSFHTLLRSELNHDLINTPTPCMVQNTLYFTCVMVYCLTSAIEHLVTGSQMQAEGIDSITRSLDLQREGVCV